MTSAGSKLISLGQRERQRWGSVQKPMLQAVMLLLPRPPIYILQHMRLPMLFSSEREFNLRAEWGSLEIAMSSTLMRSRIGWSLETPLRIYLAPPPIQQPKSPLLFNEPLSIQESRQIKRGSSAPAISLLRFQGR